MVRDLYLNPIGLLYGTMAKDAINAGDAGRLAGGDIGFCGVQVYSSSTSDAGLKMRSYQDIAASSDRAVVESLHLLEQQRPLPGNGNTSGPLIMGVVNVTPDSFSDGGEFFDPNEAVAQAKELAMAGADILDIGGESTRPGAEPVSLEDELKRVIPVVKALNGLGHMVSIDTRKADVMRDAINSGAQIVNDVTALSFDATSLDVVGTLDCPVILMHALGDPKTMQDNPVYENVVREVYDWLAERIDTAVNAGISRHNLMVDPGIGFGKNLSHNLALLSNLAFFHGLGVPVVLGASRKRFIGTLANVPEARQRVAGSIAAALKGAASGVQIIRVHDVAETRQALSVSQAIQAI